MATRLKPMITKVALVDRGSNQEADVLIYKRDATTVSQTDTLSPNPAAEPLETKEAAVADSPVTVAKADHDKAVADLTAQIEALKAPKADETFDKSALPDAVRKALADGEAAQARVAKLEADARAEQFAKKATDDYPHLGDAAELGPMLDTIDRAAPEAAQTLERVLKAANAKIDQGPLFTEIGGSGAEAGDDLDEKVEALVKAEVATGTARPEAIKKVYRDHPELLRPTVA